MKNEYELYTSQARPVLDALTRDGVCYSKEEYVQKKYGEIAPIFLTAYGWYVRQAQAIVPRPEGASYPYWAFADRYSVDDSSGGSILRLRVPRGEAVFFDVQDWNKILKLSYIGETPAEERAFADELAARGLHSSQVMLTNFYPELKARILESWKRLFRRHAAIQNGDASEVSSIQAGLWCIKKEWIVM